MNYFYKTMVLLTFACASPSAFSHEFLVQTEKVYWQYQEYAKNITGFSAVLPSKAKGDAALLKLQLSSEKDQVWFYALQASLMDSTVWENETWGTTQTNKLNIQQQDIRFDLQYTTSNSRVGAWLSRRMQIQERKNFIVNGNLIPVVGEPIDEKIVSNWLGLSVATIVSDSNPFEVSFDVAIPLSVEVTNPLFSSPFHKKDGYEIGLNLRWYEVTSSGLGLTLGYKKQELGGEQKVSGGFWPYNHWQMLSFGLLFAW